ncbi:DNA repair protein RecO [Reticulomyxa filosa]|uniref:DNA repair protein RecO n=1 Tax=Reticulomyxa filosa TaxID=46433 RepID=X6LLT6_RETFI|nr:DNA repair protein RecO [Reticulomyxa filosa]|eukprot:ETO02321.1 DNA repair protein RecO [Reticulomyxa filosa]
MIIEEKGILVAAKKFQEKSYIIKCFYESTGIVHGLFKPNKKYMQEPPIGSTVNAIWKGRLEEHLGMFTFEIISNPIPAISMHKLNIMALHSALNLIVKALAEKEPQPKLFLHLEHLIDYLATSQSIHDIIIEYLKFELFGLLATCGFGLDLSKCVVSGTLENLVYISPKSAAAVSEDIGKPYHDKLFRLPAFLADSNALITLADISECFKMSGYFLEKNLFQPLQKNLPIARNLLFDHLVK